MFDMIDSDGRPLSAVYTRTRMRWEPVMEITQIKGTSEVHPQLSPDDPFAGFEVRNKLLTGADAKVSAGSYARNALMQGLQLEQSTGANHYKFEMVGSSDSHFGLAAIREDDCYGKLASDSLPASRVEMQGNCCLRCAGRGRHGRLPERGADGWRSERGSGRQVTYVPGAGEQGSTRCQS